MLITTLSASWLSLLPPLVSIVLAVITRKVKLSLLAGTVVGALLVTNYSVVDAVSFIGNKSGGLFWLRNVNSLNIDKVSILAFLLLLGGLYSLINFSGGSVAFSNWMAQRINSAKKAQLSTIFLGIVLFIDDYFNALVVGNTCRPVTDRQNVSRAKLAYILDSTSAPVCILMPLSSWGAYLITLLGTVMVENKITDSSPFSVFLSMIPLNFYALASLGMVIVVSLFGFDIFAMKKHERQAAQGALFDSGKGVPFGSFSAKAENEGKVTDLLLPIVVLCVVSVFTMFALGARVMIEKSMPFSMIASLEYTHVGLSLLNGVVCAIVILIIRLLPKQISLFQTIKVIYSGMTSMFGAVVILVLAWLLVDVIDQIGTGNYLADQIAGVLDMHFLPALVFLVSLAIAFSTGSSWGTFGIMIPVAANLVSGIGDASLFVPVMSATAAGSVFGDHCSPISDTTVLSSVGAGCDHMDHVLTQLPYTLISGLIALIGYIVMGFSLSNVAGGVSALVTFLLICILLMVLKFVKRVG